MKQAAIFIPFLGMMLLTMLVWIYMYVLRLSYIKRNRVEPQALATNRELLEVIPARINTPSENLINLFELPVLFYAVCVFLYITTQVNSIYLILAYAFLVLRVGHSVVHCTYNNVMHRFILYIFSSLALWLMIIMAALTVLN